jgi:hypothetical protein
MSIIALSTDIWALVRLDHNASLSRPDRTPSVLWDANRAARSREGCICMLIVRPPTTDGLSLMMRLSSLWDRDSGAFTKKEATARGASSAGKMAMAPPSGPSRRKDAATAMNAMAYPMSRREYPAERSALSSIAYRRIHLSPCTVRFDESKGAKALGTSRRGNASRM